MKKFQNLKFQSLKFLPVCFLFALIFSFSILCFWGIAEAKPLGKIQPSPTPAVFLPDPLPKKGSIAVLVKGVDDQHDASVAAIVSQQLVAKGYKVVDRNKLAAMRRDAAARLALNGDVDAILRLGKKYGVGTTITVNARSGQPILNEFRLYTGTSSAAVMAVTSGGTVVYSDTVQGKQVGYTEDEAAQKAIEAAALLAVDRMTQ
jgi:hypothetical protein